MESVTIPQGAVITSRNTFDYTKYTAFINTNTCEYFFRTYDNSQITATGLWNNVIVKSASVSKKVGKSEILNLIIKRL